MTVLAFTAPFTGLAMPPALDFGQWHSTLAAYTLANYAFLLGLLEQRTERHNLFTSPEAWAGITAGSLAAARDNLLAEGFATGTANRMLTTAKVFMSRAVDLGAASPQELAAMRRVKGIDKRSARNIDEHRKQQGRPVTRPAGRKPPLRLSTEHQLAMLTGHYDDHKGRQDRAIIATGLLLGLRRGEIRSLRVEDIDTARGTIQVRRSKTGTSQTFSLLVSSQLAEAVRAVMLENFGAVMQGYLFSHHYSPDKPLAPVSIATRVRNVGILRGIKGLSPHDLRHTFAATLAAENNSAFVIQQAGGWASPEMAARYVGELAVSNRDIVLPEALR